MGCPNSTESPFSTKIAVTTPSTGEATWFMSFMTSTIATVSPAETRTPTSTNGGAPGDGARQNNPTEGDSILVPFAGAASPAGGAVGGTVAEEALATGGNGGSPAVTGPASGTPGPSGSTETAKGSVEVIELTKLQQVVARRMSESKATAPHFYLTTEVDMGAAVAARARIKEISA